MIATVIRETRGIGKPDFYMILLKRNDGSVMVQMPASTPSTMLDYLCEARPIAIEVTSPRRWRVPTERDYEYWDQVSHTRRCLPLLEIPAKGLVHIGTHQLRLAYHATYAFPNGWRASLIPLNDDYHPHRPQWEVWLLNRDGSLAEYGGGDDEDDPRAHPCARGWWQEVRDMMDRIAALPDAPSSGAQGPEDAERGGGEGRGD